MCGSLKGVVDPLRGRYIHFHVRQQCSELHGVACSKLFEVLEKHPSTLIE